MTDLTIPALFKTGGLLVALCLTGPALAQQYYPGYYPAYPQYTPYPQQQQRQIPPRQAPVKAKRTVKDTSAEKPPAADTDHLTGPFVTHVWSYKSDSLARLGKVSGASANQLLALNRLSANQLRDGQALRLPNNAATTATTADGPRQRDNQMAREVWRGLRGKKRIALTYDAGGVDDHLDLLLSNLNKADVPASFFVTGEFATKYEAKLRKIDESGFPIHNHSWSHPDFTTLDDSEIIEQLYKADDAISSVTGLSTKPYWRPPFGGRNERVLQLAASQGYQSIYWTIDSLDSVDEKKDRAFVVNRILRPPNALADTDSYLDGAILLMHVGEEGTAEAVPDIVNTLRERGFTFVTVDEILNY